MIYLAAFVLLFAFTERPVPLCETPPTPPAGLSVDLPKTKNVFEVKQPRTLKQIRYDQQCKEKI
jgi:hypothetical protein